MLLCACLVSSGLQASDCKHEKSIDQTLDLAGSEELSVLAGAGELRITGTKGGDLALIKGRVCVSEEEWLEESGVKTSGGKLAEIIVYLPDTDGDWSWSGNRYAYLDLELEVPEDVRLNVKDSSGDLEMKGVGAVDLQDSSGDIDITLAMGPVSIRIHPEKLNSTTLVGMSTLNQTAPAIFTEGILRGRLGSKATVPVISSSAMLVKILSSSVTRPVIFPRTGLLVIFR